MRHIQNIDSFSKRQLMMHFNEYKRRIESISKKELNYIVDKITDYEDMGYVIAIDICQYYEVSGNKYESEGLLYGIYSTIDNNLPEYSNDFTTTNPNRDILDSIAKAFDEGRICYRLSFMNSDESDALIDHIYDDVARKFEKFGVVGPIWNIDIMEYIGGILLKSNI